VADIREPNKATYEYGQFKELPGTSGVPGVPDTFFGPRNKVYADYIQRQITRLRGTNCYYYVLDDMSERVDGDRPISDAENRGRTDIPEGTPEDAFARKRHAGKALYGEHAIVRRRLDSVRREIQPDWPYLSPILVRVLMENVEHEQEADERGAIHIRRADVWIARVLCEKEWNIQPRAGDILRFSRLLDQYLDVEDVSRDESVRVGGDGYYVGYKLMCVKSSKYEPQRKIGESKLTEEPPPDGSVDPNPGGLT
jgi:hypothetical protein